MPASVKALAISDNTDKNCPSKLSSSIIHQVEPGPGDGVARNMKMTIAVPISVARASGASARVSLAIRNTMMAKEPAKISSCAYSKLLKPTASVKTTNRKPPPRIHQFGCVLPTCWASAAAAACRLMPPATSCRRARDCNHAALITPSTEISGITNDISYTLL